MNSVLILTIIMANIIEAICQPLHQDHQCRGAHTEHKAQCHPKWGEAAAFHDSAQRVSQRSSLNHRGGKRGATVTQIFPTKKLRHLALTVSNGWGGRCEVKPCLHPEPLLLTIPGVDGTVVRQEPSNSACKNRMVSICLP